MKLSLFRWGTALLASLAIAGCGGGGGGTAPTTGTAVSTAIATASVVPANDTSTNTSSAFTVLQAAGVPAVTVNSPPVVNFTVFSNGEVVTGLTNSNVRFAIAKLVPGSNGESDQWVSYISKTVTGVAPTVKASAPQATTDTATPAQLVYNADGYYTYTFKTDIKTVAGVTYDPSLTHRVAIQLSYKNAAGATVLSNPYFDFTIVDGKSVPVTDPSKTRKMTDVTSCNSCHEKLALHGGGRIDTQYCVMCHNPGTVDPESGNNLNMSTMIHSIHAGSRIKAQTDEDYTIWGYGNSKHDYAEVGFPQDLRNCTKCHSASNPATPQGDNWKTSVSQQACLSCHNAKAGGVWETAHKVYASSLVGVGAAAADLTNAQCVACHKVGSNISPEVVHWNQNEENSALYKMNIESVTVKSLPTYNANSALATDGFVTVKYFLSNPINGNAAYDLKADSTSAKPDPTKFSKLSLMLGYAKTKGQSTAVTEFSNGGSEKVTANTGTDLGGFHYSVDIKIPKLTSLTDAVGTARVVSYGQVLERRLVVKSNVTPRPEVDPQTELDRVNTLVQNTFEDVALTGTLQPRRAIVSNEKCNVCHGALGATSGSNTLAEAFHSGARNTVEACAVCHDANKVSSTVMTDSSAFNESYQFMRMIHGIHGNSKRVYPFTHGNPVQGAFSKAGVLAAPGGSFLAAYSIRGFTPTSGPVSFIAAATSVSVGETFQSIGELITAAAVNVGYTGSAITIENYAAEVAWPGVGINCNACHVNNSYKQDMGALGSVIRKDVGVTDPNGWKVISPKAASCTSCHDSSAAIGHVTAFGGSAFGNKTQAEIAALPRETCNDCHASGGFKGVDIVHGQQ